MIKFVGIIRGTYSEMQAIGEGTQVVHNISGTTLDGVLDNLVLPEWIYKLYVNGRRIANPEKYLKRKGLWANYVRKGDYDDQA